MLGKTQNSKSFSNCFYNISFRQGRAIGVKTVGVVISEHAGFRMFDFGFRNEIWTWNF